MNNENNTYNYPAWFRNFYLSFHLVILVSLLFVLIDGSVEIINAAITNEALINGIRKLLVVVLIGSLSLSVLTTPMEIITTSKGMKIKLYFLFNKFISWDDVIGIKQWPFQTDFFLVKVRRLTIFHRMTGVSYLFGIEPVFPVHKPLEDVYRLVEEIKEHI